MITIKSLVVKLFIKVFWCFVMISDLILEIITLTLNSYGFMSCWISTWSVLADSNVIFSD